ncbi:hypothetical protein NHX12_008544 [Muraenolepis orangiensis]|uniref:Fibronectin type-III domain-containing protein 3A n=1 Tax=Muraenolepis orangiensis TaxID=630683 RepID=A0A9Q0DLH7_9TELE|nr:hypothetical protein NHX12_008544 [Muraenolepis orangiensis]
MHSQSFTAGGPAQVPMMSPNGSVPPIYVPPGYVSQIIEENGVRRVLVLPQQPEFHPGGHSPLHHAPPLPHAHLPAFISHPAMMPPLPHLYTGMAGGVGDMGSQYISQYHPAHIYSEQVSTDSHPQHGRPQFVHRDDRMSKTYERLQKKLKDHGSTPTAADVHNGLGGKGLEFDAGQPSAGADGLSGRGKNGQSEELEQEAKALQALLSTISKPEVTDIQARGSVLSWSAPTRTPDSQEGSAEEVPPSLPEPINYEVSISFIGKDEKYDTTYSGEELSATLEDLRPATDYHVRVQAVCKCVYGGPSEVVNFTTLTCEPEPPNAPRKSSGTKSALVLQWKAPCDNGSKIQNYILQWDEGKGTGVYEQCYYGPQKQYRVTKLSPASRYSFRLAAKNDMGISEFSEVVDLITSCSVPCPPLPPDLLKAGVTWLCLQWQRPSGSPKEDDIYYVLEMEEEGSGYGFQPSYDGEDLSCTVKNLHRSTKYKFRVAAYNTEGKSNPSHVAEFTTSPDRPGCPCRPGIRGRVLPNSFKMAWEPPKDNGGSEVTKYVVERSEGLSGVSWELVYSGPALEHVCEGLKPGCSYQSRIYCMSEGGQSLLSETLQVQTPAVPPGQCQPPRLVGRAKARELQLRWGPPLVDGGNPVSCYSVEVSGPQAEESREVYQGAELDSTVGSLLPGRTYAFRLRAANRAGFGPLSESCEVTTGPGAPEPCRAPTTSCRSPSCVVVSWEVPLGNGAPVTDYRVEWGVAEGTMGVSYSGPALSTEVKGLLPATNYYCRVQAVNVAGVGPFGEAVLCQTPCSVPAAVANVHALKESEMRTYAPPCDHGSPITSYLIDLGERQPLAIGPVSRHVLQNLQPDTAYRLGAGPFSHAFKLKTKPLPPLPPRLECTAFSHQTLRLKWGEGPGKASASDALQYQLQMEDRSGRLVSVYKGPCHTHKVQRLNESTSYTFRIQAFNEAGQGPFSNVYTFTTMLGNSDFKQEYKGPSTSHVLHGLASSSDYRFRVCAVRQCQDAPELAGPYSPTITLSPPRGEAQGGGAGGGGPGGAGLRAGGGETARPRRSLSDEQCAFLLLMAFAVIAILIAFVIQYFVIK